MRVHELQERELDLWAAKAAGVGDRVYRPTADWADAGPIIEREGISVWRYPNLDSWHAGMELDFTREDGLKVKHYYQGPNPLVAAMRCFVASRFGAQVSQERPA